MNVGLRLKDELVAEIDRVAAANGQTRSSWMANALANAVLAPENDDIPVMPIQGRGHPDDNIRVTVRLDRREIEGIDAVAAPMGMTRNEWIKRTLRWQLWDKAGVLRLAPATQAEIVKLRKQVLLIGRNINQAVHAMNAANQPESSLDIARIAGPFIEKCEELKTLLFTTRLALWALRRWARHRTARAPIAALTNMPMMPRNAIAPGCDPSSLRTHFPFMPAPLQSVGLLAGSNHTSVMR